MEILKNYIRSIPDFPKPGILFYDICPLLQNAEGFQLVIQGLENLTKKYKPAKIVGIEARGFILGAAVADRLNLGFVPMRKLGKLPGEKISAAYDLEYGSHHLEIQKDAINQNDEIVIIDDLVATGGTLATACELVTQLGGKINGIVCAIALTHLNFQEKLSQYPLDYLIHYEN